MISRVLFITWTIPKQFACLLAGKWGAGLRLFVMLLGTAESTLSNFKRIPELEVLEFPEFFFV